MPRVTAVDIDVEALQAAGLYDPTGPGAEAQARGDEITPENAAWMATRAQLLAKAGVAPGDITAPIVHATTLITNALSELSELNRKCGFT